jgi:hexosaminidase
VNHSLWKECPEIKEFMAENKIGNLRGAQVYFTKRLEGILAGHNKKMIGWNEILNDKLERSTGIMSWIGTGPGYNAAKRGFPVVMSPGPYTYFDMSYVGAYDEPPSHWWAGKIDCARSYSFDPLGNPGLNADQAKKIMGIHGCLWSEFVKPWKSKSGWAELKTYGEHADYKTFPRLCAMAEVGWTPQSERSFSDFADRLGPTHLRRLKAAGVTLRVPPCGAVIRKGMIYILPPYAGAEVRYTLDGSDPFNSESVTVWDSKPFKGNGAKFRARTYFEGQPSPLHIGAKLDSVGKWNKASVTEEFAEKEFDLTGALDEPGVWRLGFRKTKGRDHLIVRRVDILIDGKIAASDTHDGGSAGQSKYRFNIETSVPASAKVIAKVSMKAAKRDNKAIQTEGELTLEKSEYLEPETVVSSKIGHYGNNSVDNLADYNRDTFFWSNRSVHKGETVLFRFAKPIKLKSIESVSGKINDPTKDILQNGILEISEDGSSFRKVADFRYGAAKADLHGAAVAAVRITATADHSDWLVLQDLLLIGK